MRGPEHAPEGIEARSSLSNLGCNCRDTGAPTEHDSKPRIQEDLQTLLNPIFEYEPTQEAEEEALASQCLELELQAQFNPVFESECTIAECSLSACTSPQNPYQFGGESEVEESVELAAINLPVGKCDQCDK